VTLGTHQDVEVTLMGRPFDGALEIQFFRCAGTSEFPQATQC
jgi:hypothetical protein